MFARFNENPAMTLQDIKETKRYGRTDGCTDGRTDGQRENSIPPTNKVCGGYKKYPTHFHKLHSPHEIKSHAINQTALTIRSGSKTTPDFNLRRADGNFRLYGGKN